MLMICTPVRGMPALLYVHVCISVLRRDLLFLASPRSSTATPPLTNSAAPVSLASAVVPVPLIKGLALQRTALHTCDLA